MVKKTKKEYKFLQKCDPLDKWNRKDEIGDGSFGKVYLVTKKDGSLSAACKVCAIDSEMDMDDMAQEVNILLTCENQFILKAFEAFFYEGSIHMILELCTGGGLDDVIMEFETGLYEPFIQAIMYQMFVALNYMHKKGIIHRDIKAGNMLLTDKGLLKLADFGVSGVNTQPGQKRSTFIGTPYWMAPEVIVTETNPDKPYDERCDVWSMGITCIELAESQPPNSEHHPMCVMFFILKNPPPTFQEPEKWSASFIEFTARCLTYDSRKRPSCADCLALPFLDITEAKSRDIVRELYRAYKEEPVEEELNIDIDGSNEGLAVNTELDNTSHTSLGSQLVHTESVSRPSNDAREALKTVRKTRRFNVDGQMRTESVVTVVDHDRRNILQREAKAREQGMNEIKRLRRLEQTEMEKRKELVASRLEELERVQMNERTKQAEKTRSEVEVIENQVNKDFTRKEMSCIDDQKQFAKKIRKELDKDIKQFKNNKKTASRNQKTSVTTAPTAAEHLQTLQENYKKTFDAFIEGQNADLLLLKQQLLEVKQTQCRLLEAESWTSESKQLMDFVEAKIGAQKEISSLILMHVLRRFRKELSLLKERSEIKIEDTRKKQLLEQKELPKQLKTQMKVKLETEKKQYRKQGKKGLSQSAQSEKDYLRTIYDAELLRNEKAMIDLKSVHVLEIEKLKAQYDKEHAEILNLQEEKEKEVFLGAMDGIEKLKDQMDHKIREFLDELEVKKTELTINHQREVQEIKNYRIKSAVEF